MKNSISPQFISSTIAPEIIFFQSSQTQKMASGSNPQSSQIMPRRLKVAVEAREAEIAEMKAELQRLSDSKDAQIASIAEEESHLRRLKTEIRDRRDRIFRANGEIENINAITANLEVEIMKKSAWVDDVKAIYN